MTVSDSLLFCQVCYIFFLIFFSVDLQPKLNDHETFFYMLNLDLIHWAVTLCLYACICRFCSYRKELLN